MRYLFIVFLIVVSIAACKRRPTKNPTPALEFKNFSAYQVAGRDTAILTIGYEDGDGDIFSDNNASHHNLFITPYFYNEFSNKYESVLDPITQDTFRISYIVRQPDNGYYKGKSIKGEVIVPMAEFRQDSTQKNLRYNIWMVDMSGKKSNVVASPGYTLTF